MIEGKKVLKYHRESRHINILLDDGDLLKIDGQNEGELKTSFVNGDVNLQDMKDRLHTIRTEIDKKEKERNELSRLIAEVEEEFERRE